MASGAGPAARICDQIVQRTVAELKIHPGIQRHNIVPSIGELSALAKRGEDAFREPLVITMEGYILDGDARWMLAKQLGQAAVQCLLHDLNEEKESLCFSKSSSVRLG